MPKTKRPLKLALKRGVLQKCPSCGEGRLFYKYLKTPGTCSVCSTPLDAHQADDAPPYLTILLLGHVIIPLMYLLEKAYAPALWVHISIFGTLTLVMTLLALPLIKGAVIGLQWAFYMHGFDIPDADAEYEDRS